MTWMLWLALITALLAATVGALTAFGAKRWEAATRLLGAELEAARVPMAATHYDPRELEGLPAPVQRYFQAALTPGQAVVTAATIHMTGRFNLSATAEQWRPFTSQQRVVTRRPGFLWNARVAMLPGVAVRVVDSFIAGTGLLKARVLGLFTVASLQGTGEIARGEFMRYLAETPWYPTALLPSQGVRWEPVDAYSANATLGDGPLALTLLFRFNEAGLIDAFRAEARGGMVAGVMVQAPWEGRFSNHQVCDGMQVPFTGEVAWMRPDGRKPYFRGTVTQVEYEFAVASQSKH